ncbi:hypothetical protein FRC12_023671 [Ceratobasidium sp. 428]|nr:hypothetical protein FRC12_023671 [Ceratobasidium sp. 428]
MFEDIVTGGKKPYRARAGDPGLSVPHLFPFFDSSAYTGMDDSKYGFFTIYRGLFTRLAAEEAAWSSANGETFEYPPFGDANTPWIPETKQTALEGEYAQHFYREWSNFITAKDFSWRDIWDTSEAPDRRIRRLMEQDNKSARQESRREYNDAIKALVAFVRKRDPRFKAFKDAQAKNKTANRTPKPTGPAPSAFVEQDWQRSRPTTDDHADLDWGRAEGNKEEYECVVCGKFFRSEAAWSSHERSKKHMKEVQRLKRQMQAENVELGLDAETQGDGAPNEEASTPVDGKTETIPSDEGPDHQVPTTMSKKQKKKMRKARAMARQGESATQSPEDHKDTPLPDDLTKPMQGLSVETGDAQENSADESDGDDDQKPGETSAPTKREKRRAREAAKKAREAETPAQICNVCAESFESRSKLFTHIEASGHQLATPHEKDEGPQRKQGSTKKGKSKGKR